MTTFVRRFLVLAALLFWQGGFLFYSAVVVPVGQEVLQSAHTGVTQGFITRRVTIYLNVAGAIALLPLGADSLVGGTAGRWRRRLRLLTWAGMAVTLVMLVIMQPRLDEFLNSDLHLVEDMKAFR